MMKNNSFKVSYRVIYGDTDRLGVVYNANYFRIFEIGRTEFFRNLGITYKEIEDKKIFMPVAEANCKYIKPIHYDDLIAIETSIDPEYKKGICFLYTILSEDEKRVCAKGFTKHAFINSEHKVIRPPEFIKDLMLD
jgi:acyl-CoA thioester hydrolase